MAAIDARELIRLAKRDEDVGAEFYQKLAEKVESENLKEKFLEIREQEIGHSERFQKMLDQLSDYVPQEDFPGEYEQYFQSFLSKREYLDSDDAVEAASRIKSDMEAIKFALGQEKNTLLFFLEMKELLPSSQHREMVHEVIDEERDHIVQLSQMIMDRL
ncbi:MAG: ferritin family protein [Candidatus Krumholzibacteriales bacterium]